MAYSDFTLRKAKEELNLSLTIDLTEYLIPPVEKLLSMLVWMVKEG
jgi:hypothetical protein